MTTTAELFEVAVAALKGTTAAGRNVFSPRDFPTWDDNYPIINVRLPEEDKVSIGNISAPQFTVTATLTIEARCQAVATGTERPFDEGAAKVEAGLLLMSEQIQRALINNPPLMSKLQQFPFIRTAMDISSEGEKHLGQLVVKIGLEFYQGPEDFYEIPADDLIEVRVHVDAQNVFDPNGTYPASEFPDSVQPAPRTSGPDGRDEGLLHIHLPQ